MRERREMRMKEKDGEMGGDDDEVEDKDEEVEQEVVNVADGEPVIMRRGRIEEVEDREEEMPRRRRRLRIGRRRMRRRLRMGRRKGSRWWMTKAGNGSE